MAGDTTALQTAAAKAQAAKTAQSGEPEPEADSKITDRVVRIMLGFAWGMVPEEYANEDGKTIKVDKSDPKKFIIPVDEARKVIRAASRSAYAQICSMPDRQHANYVTFMRGEKARNVWSEDQMIFINSLHLFTVLYLTGNAKVVERDPASMAAGEGAPDTAAKQPSTATSAPTEPAKPPIPGMSPVPKSNAPGVSIGMPEAPPLTPEMQKNIQDAENDPNRPKCSDEQKQRVQQAIDTYVKNNSKS